MNGATQLVAPAYTFVCMDTINYQPTPQPLAAATSEASAKLTPVAPSIQSRNALKLWTIRLLVKLGADDNFIGHSTRPNLGRPAGDLRSVGLRLVDLDSIEAA